MKDKSLKHFAWLKSIKVMVRGQGYMTDDDCHRIQEYFLKELHRAVQETFVKEEA